VAVIEIEGAWNVRDVGGIAASDGVIRTGVLLRSGNLARVTDAGSEALRDRVRHIVDLRGDEELVREPTAVTGLPITHLPLFFGSVDSFLAQDASLDELYGKILEEGTGKIIDAVRIIAAGEPTLVHCTVGKDRTGVTVGLALAAVGADREAVVADYALTESLLPRARTDRALAFLRTHHPDAVHLEALVRRSPAPVMRALLGRIDEDFGSASAYLRAHGLTASELTDLRRALVET